MPNIYDNAQAQLLPELHKLLREPHAASLDLCVGYFNLRGWSQLAEALTHWQADPQKPRVRLIIGKQIHDDVRAQRAHALFPKDTITAPDQPTAFALRQEAAETLRRQLSLTPPSAADLAGLNLLKDHLRSGLLHVKFFARHPLHAKLYLVHRKENSSNPHFGIVGSSNLTLAGLKHQGELNTSVEDGTATGQLAAWFQKYWNDGFCLDLNAPLLALLEDSWASERGYTPYEIYLKMVYHLASEARAGMVQYTLPAEFERTLLPFQKEAVKIAARYLYARGGVLLGDVVGLGKTLMATALAKLFEEDTDSSTLVVCPPNLQSMWEGYIHKYGLRGLVISTGKLHQLQHKATARHRLLIVDESHNLRNPESQRYKQLKDFLDQSECKCVLLSATPYNKSYLDLAAQIGLFWGENEPLPIRPERLLRDLSEADRANLQADPHTLAAFAKSQHAEDWRELMRLFLVRRTRAFIKTHYAQQDERGHYLTLANGQRVYFPQRLPRALTFEVTAQYAQLYAAPVVETINALHLPRYGLGQYVVDGASAGATAAQRLTLKNLSRAGKRLIAYCRIGLFKRLESSGAAFLLSLQRHVARNAAILHALHTGQPVPVGQPDPALLDARLTDDDEADTTTLPDPATLYARYTDKSQKHKFDWLPAAFFTPALAEHLQADNAALTAVLAQAGAWQAAADAKLNRLHTLLAHDHPTEKVLVFSQFADTVTYLTEHLRQRGLTHLEGVTGAHPNPAEVAARFSPHSHPTPPTGDPVRVLITTDVLSEGQNLQDAHLLVNFDLPWAIIRLIQRAGRVDRIGQQAETITCYSFWPAAGVDELIGLRRRVLERLRQNGEVIGSDEAFFEEQSPAAEWHDLYAGRPGALDDRAEDDDTDPASGALALWQAASQANPKLAERVQRLNDGLFAAKARQPNDPLPPGVLVYARSANGLDVLGRVDAHGQLVAESPLAVLRAAACHLDTPAAPLADYHHDVVMQAARTLLTLPESTSVGLLGKSSGVRARTYHRLKDHFTALKAVHGPLWVDRDLEQAIDQLFSYPLRQTAHRALHRQLSLNIPTPELAELVKSLFLDDRLCQLPHTAQEEADTARVLCSLGVV